MGESGKVRLRRRSELALRAGMLEASILSAATVLQLASKSAISVLAILSIKLLTKSASIYGYATLLMRRIDDANCSTLSLRMG